MAQEPIRVAIVDDFEVVVRGVAQLLTGRDRIQLVDLAAGEPVEQHVDVVLLDTFGQGEADAPELDVLLDHRRVDRVVLYTWQTDPALVEQARARGFDGYLSKQLSGRELADALRRIHGGEVVVQLARRSNDAAASARAARAWPGEEHGLTEREAEVLTHVTAGRSNAEIAELLHLSPNSVKTHIRSAYRCIGVDSRTRAVLWGVDNGLRPPHDRLGDWRASR